MKPQKTSGQAVSEDTRPIPENEQTAMTREQTALEVASLAGEVLLASGAEIFRVEETISLIAKSFQIANCDSFVLSSGIFLTARSREASGFAKVRHIPFGAVRLDRVAAVNQLSREIVDGKHDPADALKILQEIQQMPAKRTCSQLLASGIGSGCFCFLFGGDIVDSMLAFLAGLLLYGYLLYLVKGRLSKIASNITGAALVTAFCVLLFSAGIGHHLAKMIIGSIIPLVPGVPFTNAIRDIADEDYIAGAVRMLDALLVTFCIAIGVGFIILGYYRFAGGAII